MLFSIKLPKIVRLTRNLGVVKILAAERTSRARLAGVYAGASGAGAAAGKFEGKRIEWAYD
jgi:hypothetical protein